MIDFEGAKYFDDRMYVLELRVTPDGQKLWTLITRRNSPGYPPTRSDGFDEYRPARAYMEKVEPTVPRVSLDGKPLEPTPSLAEHRAWVDGFGGRQCFDEYEGKGKPFFPGKVSVTHVDRDGGSSEEKAGRKPSGGNFNVRLAGPDDPIYNTGLIMATKQGNVWKGKQVEDALNTEVDAEEQGSEGTSETFIASSIRRPSKDEE